MSAAVKGHSMKDLRVLTEQQQKALAELQSRIDTLRHDLAAGTEIPKTLNLTESSNKDTTKGLVQHIELIEEQAQVTATDREMLQALNARLAVCDQLAMKLAELRELEHEARGAGSREVLEFDENDTIPLRRKSGDEDEPKGMHIKQVPACDQGQSLEEQIDIEWAEPVGKSAKNDAEWLNPYKILGIEPGMPDKETSVAAKRALLKLNSKHNPSSLPNDPEAPMRWEIILKAYELLSDPDKRQYLIAHHKLPVVLEDLDFESLHLE